MRILRTENAYESMDDGARMGKEIVHIYFKRFVPDTKRIYKSYFLNRRPTAEEMSQVVGQVKGEGFPGCGGDIDCIARLW